MGRLSEAQCKFCVGRLSEAQRKFYFLINEIMVLSMWMVGISQYVLIKANRVADSLVKAYTGAPPQPHPTTSHFSMLRIFSFVDLISYNFIYLSHQTQKKKKKEDLLLDWAQVLLLVFEIYYKFAVEFFHRLSRDDVINHSIKAPPCVLAVSCVVMRDR